MNRNAVGPGVLVGLVIGGLALHLHLSTDPSSPPSSPPPPASTLPAGPTASASASPSSRSTSSVIVDPQHEPEVGSTSVATTAPIASASPDGTTIVVLRVRRDAVELASAARKPMPFPRAVEPAAAAARWRLEDPSGARLAEGGWTPPALCDCARGADHSRGCVRIHHEAVVRLKVPHVAAHEVLVLCDAAGDVAARLPLETP